MDYALHKRNGVKARTPNIESHLLLNFYYFVSTQQTKFKLNVMLILVYGVEVIPYIEIMGNTRIEIKLHFATKSSDRQIKENKINFLR